ncbi:MAG: WYL domain-containing protein [Chitinivibrionales bacterium]|nr:WYL domain-containing protein [Chitinivibrionales bacterium]
MDATEIPKYLRIVKIYSHLIRNRTRKYSVQDMLVHLQDEGDVSLRNVQRDLKDLTAITDSGVICAAENGKRVYFIEPDNRKTMSLPIRNNGLLAFFLLKRLQPFFAPHAKNLNDIGEALMDLSGDRVYDLFDDLDEKLLDTTYKFGEQTALTLNNNLLNDLLVSLVKRRKLKILYQGGNYDKPQEKIICPARLVLHNGELYFICASEHDYYLKLSRILKAELLPDTFSPVPEKIKKIEKRLTESFGILDEAGAKQEKIIIRFPAEPYYKLLFTERKYHHSQKLTIDNKGNHILTMCAPIGFDLINWILCWPEAIVLEPKKLRGELAKKGKELLVRYQKQNKS